MTKEEIQKSKGKSQKFKSKVKIIKITFVVILRALARRISCQLLFCRPEDAVRWIPCQTSEGFFALLRMTKEEIQKSKGKSQKFKSKVKIIKITFVVILRALARRIPYQVSEGFFAPLRMTATLLSS